MGQELFEHGNIARGYVHGVTNWRFVDTAARNDPSNNFTFRDLDKMCYDAQTEKYYILKSINPDYTPVWELCSSPAASGEANTLVTLGAGQSLAGAKVGVNLQLRAVTGSTDQIVITQNIDGAVNFAVSPNLRISWPYVSGKPSTLAGYGIVDAAPASHTHAVASASASGFMSSADWSKLQGIEPGAKATTNIITKLVGSAISSVRVVSAISDTSVGLTNPADPASVKTILGLTTTAASLVGDPINIQVSGTYYSAGWGLSVGPVFLGTAGQLTQVVPTSGFLVTIGYAVNPNTLVLTSSFDSIIQLS